MMFDALAEKFDNVFRKLRGVDRLTEENVRESLRDVKLALLEADVNFKVVKDLVSSVQARVLGEETLKGVDPSQQFIAAVHDELVRTLTGTEEDKPFAPKPGKDQMILLLGLQGSGKTTFAGKLAKMLAGEGLKPLLVACDVYRPAAVEQLKTVGRAVNVPVFEMGTDRPVVEIVKAAREHARKTGRDIVIVDTAGRLHIDEVKMDELKAVRDTFAPDFTFYVCDAMTGQDAVTSAQAFDREVGIDGVCLTKMDGDARGGAALSVKAVTGKPIVFVGVGEKSDDLERFHPERAAQRILGMGDVVSLVEKAQSAISEKDAQDMTSKLAEGTFNWDDFIRHMKMVRRMGSLKSLLSMFPGVGRQLKDVDGDQLEKSLKNLEAIVSSMTAAERKNGELLLREPRRRLRVAKGSGHTLPQVDQVVRQFEQMRQFMREMTGGGGVLGSLMGGGGKKAMQAYRGGEPFPGGNPFAGRDPEMMPKPGDPEFEKMAKELKRMERERKQLMEGQTRQKFRKRGR
jgi:signal recognition particle subunit SRP54